MNQPFRPSGGPSGWIRYWSQKRGDKLAIISSDKFQLTYFELYATIRSVANWLKKNGLRKNEPLFICTENEIEARILRWSANLCGSIDAIQDFRMSISEIKHRVNVLNPAMIVSDHTEKFKGLSKNILSYPKEIVTKFTDFGSEDFEPQQNLRILFTTGSTGSPKAVLQLVGQIDGVTESNIIARNLQSDDVLLAFLPTFHSAGSLFEDSMLKLGATIRIPEMKDPKNINKLLDEENITVTTMVPSVISKILNVKGGARSLNKLRLINYAGEKIEIGLLEKLIKKYDGKLMRGYGLTEAGPLVSVLDDVAHRKELPDSSCIGRPAPEVQVKTIELDESGIGELCVRSPFIMAKYWNDDHASKERIHDGWLHTGDLVRIENGLLHIFGRIGDRIRSGGEWIHPAEVEGVIEKVAEISEVSVVGIEHPVWGQRPVAFITAKTSITREQIIETLKSGLSKFKWPDWCHHLDVMPFTGPGKVDRVLLKKLASMKYPDEMTIIINKDNI